MILNVCIEDNKMVDEKVCKNCHSKNCRYAGEPTTKEKLDISTYGTADYWDGETDSAQ